MKTELNQFKGCELIIEFLQHIFSTKEIKHPNGSEILAWELGLDYIQLMLLHPSQKLPMIIFHSSSYWPSGKTTLFKFILELLNVEATYISNIDNFFKNEDLDALAGIKLACSEESVFDGQTIRILRHLQQVTELRVNLRSVPVAYEKYYCKYWFTARSLVANRFQLDQNFWVINIKRVDTPHPNLFDQLYAQIPAFKEFLQKRQYRTRNESYFWFHPYLTLAMN